jgi:hypothetical protein
VLTNPERMNSKNEVNCKHHGKQEIGLLCTHLAHSLVDGVKCGFNNDGSNQEQELGRPDAWCNNCNSFYLQTTSDEEYEKWFTESDFKILCVKCWDEAKVINAR